MTRILVITQYLWPHQGGAELATYHILQLLKSYGHDITVVTGVQSLTNISGVRYIYSKKLDVRNKIELWSNLYQLTHAFWFNELVKKADLVYIPGIAYSIIPFLRHYKKKIVIHLHNYQPINYHATILHNKSACNRVIEPFIDSFKMGMLEDKSLFRALSSTIVTPLNLLCRKWLVDADVIICVSKRQEEILTEKAPELSKKTRVIYNLVQKSRGPPEEKTNNRRFLYVGGNSYIKGINTLAEAALRLIKAERCQFDLVKIEDIKFQKFLESLNNRKFSPFKVYGKLNYFKLAKMRENALALVFPSLSEEPFPFAVVEAMLSKTIPIASCVGGVPEIVCGTFAEAMLFAPEDVNALESRMNSVLSLSDEHLEDIGSCLRETVLKRFSVELIKNQLSDVFC